VAYVVVVLLLSVSSLEHILVLVLVLLIGVLVIDRSILSKLLVLSLLLLLLSLLFRLICFLNFYISFVSVLRVVTIEFLVFFFVVIEEFPSIVASLHINNICYVYINYILIIYIPSFVSYTK
jgi:hypothetical protein